MTIATRLRLVIRILISSFLRHEGPFASCAAPAFPVICVLVSPKRPPFECPVCGESVPRNAKACPECGACEKSGWSADAAYEELPEEDFDYDRFVANEFGGKPKTSRKERFWWLAGIIILAAFAWLILRGLFQ